MPSIGSLFLYTVLTTVVLIMITVDMFALKKIDDHKVSVKEALISTLNAEHFLLANMANRFAFLQYGLATILIFIASKMLLLAFDFHISTSISLTVGLAILIGSVLISLKSKPKTE